MNLLEFQTLFPDETACEQYLLQRLWPQGFQSPHCGGQGGWYLKARRSFECQHCHRQESVTAQTLFHRSRSPLREWFLAIYLICESKKGISVLELAHHLGMKDERRAERMKKRIQAAMGERNDRYLLQDFVEFDEAFFVEAGESVPVAVCVSVNEQDRPEYVRFQVLDNLKGGTVEAAAKKCVAPEAVVVTDGHPSHNGFKAHFQEHIACVQRVPALCREYLPWVHILISNAKRFIGGTHHAVNHLQGFLDEFAWRFNRRFCDLFDRMILSSLTYKPGYLL